MLANVRKMLVRMSHGHSHQALAGIVQRQRLMLVLVLAVQIHLADAFDRGVAEHLGQRPHLQAPVAGNPVRAGQVGPSPQTRRTADSGSSPE